MNRNIASGFCSPLVKSSSDTEMADNSFPPCSQKSPSYSDSPNRGDLEKDNDYLDLTEQVDAKQTLQKIEKVLSERLRIATIKESILYHQGINKIPGFMGLNIRFNPSCGSKEAREIFDKEIDENILTELKKSFGSSLVTICDKLLTEKMKEAYEIRNKAVNSLDIKDAGSGKIRTELYTEFDKIKEKFRKERASFATKLRTAPSEDEPEDKRTPVHKKHKTNQFHKQDGPSRRRSYNNSYNSTKKQRRN